MSEAICTSPECGHPLDEHHTVDRNDASRFAGKTYCAHETDSGLCNCTKADPRTPEEQRREWEAFQRECVHCNCPMWTQSSGGEVVLGHDPRDPRHLCQNANCRKTGACRGFVSRRDYSESVRTAAMHHGSTYHVGEPRDVFPEQGDWRPGMKRPPNPNRGSFASIATSVDMGNWVRYCRHAGIEPFPDDVSPADKE